MKLFITILMFISINLFPKESGKIVIEVINCNSDDGKIKAALHNNKESFPKKSDGAVAKSEAKIKSNKSVIVFDNVKFGEYAFSIHHDENDNGKIDKNFVGIPNEPLAASNNAKGFMGPPSFEKAKFTLDKPEIKLVVDMNK